MKPFKRIMILSTLVTGVVLFWLMPRINKADSVHYTRRYEDTDKQNKKENDTKKTKEPVLHPQAVAASKVYKKESIHADDKLLEISASKFSRAMQFEMIEEVDSIQEVPILTDSIKL